MCNCVVIWDLLGERHVWVSGSLDGSCGHPPSGTPYEAEPVPDSDDQP